MIENIAKTKTAPAAASFEIAIVFFRSFETVSSAFSIPVLISSPPRTNAHDKSKRQISVFDITKKSYLNKK